MLEFLKTYSVFAFAQALLTAILLFAFTKTVPSERDQAHKAFFKVLVAGLLVGAALTYVATKPEALVTEPFLNVVPHGLAAP